MSVACHTSCPSGSTHAPRSSMTRPGSFRRARADMIAASANPHSPDTILFATLLSAHNETHLLGLSCKQTAWLYERHFGGLAAPAASVLICSEEHAAFIQSLSDFLLSHVAVSADITNAQCLATIIAHACLRTDHLWRDLGLGGRDDVTAMLDRYFPALVKRNTDGTRWKKFLARELAWSTGLTPRPAPGCPGCEDFDFCFGARS
ncbi:nitrogen fixation protein NifQ [Burkholderia sp. Leaf177]|uniref:nitrogen fixation protein NifQ n=1 Tax=Burkholderia sp. Leaf177 TaxID=1736287 RepID=UPI0026D3F6E1